MRSLHSFSLLAVVMMAALSGCKMKMTYSFQDSRTYLVQPKKLGKAEVFLPKLEAWCAANGYGPAGAADFPVFTKTPEALATVQGAELARVRYLDPARKTSGVLLTFEKMPDREGVVWIGFYTNRQGTEAETARQEGEIEKLRSELLAAFPGLR